MDEDGLMLLSGWQPCDPIALWSQSENESQRSPLTAAEGSLVSVYHLKDSH